MWYAILLALSQCFTAGPMSKAAEPAFHYVNTRELDLKADVEVGPTGLARASLYLKEGSSEWQKHPSEIGTLAAPPLKKELIAVGPPSPDPKRIIPLSFKFRVPKDGLYEFAIVVQNEHESNRAVPKSGDRGDMRVVVDTEKPTVIIFPAKVTRGGATGTQMEIRWTARDTNLATAPIKLEYWPARAGKGEAGEWKAIAPDWIPNNGVYLWSVPTGVASEFFIRVLCKDRAGNETRTETLKPINVDLAVPALRNVRIEADDRGRIDLAPIPKR